jgi:hypothetical protein
MILQLQRHATQCLDFEVRIMMRPLAYELRNRKDTCTLVNPVWLRFQSPQDGLAASMMRLLKRYTSLQATPFSMANRTNSADVRTPSFWRMIDEVFATVL